MFSKEFFNCILKMFFDQFLNVLNVWRSQNGYNTYIHPDMNNKRNL